ncbi:hypothetical protein F5Y07DRAFT_411871 [Xylaria sp. FL0933]|nr:hypothetical protein F5Y07DRAFT_411871 [Xylaria sp. FL0933]
MRPRRCPYQRVEVRGLFWENHNHHLGSGPVRNANQELSMVLGAFETYGYNVNPMAIPGDPRARSGFPSWLRDRLSRLAQPSGSTLIILYYQGHGALRGDGLVLSNGNGQSMHWADIAGAIVNARCDVLTILNCCHAGAAMRYRMPARANYEAHIKQVMMAVPEHRTTNWGYAAGFAACPEQALRDGRTNWEESFKGVPDHWGEAINRIMARKSLRAGPVGVRHLIAPPPTIHQRPIVVSPR